MYLDHPRISATRSDTEPDRIERLNRVYGYAIGLADMDGNSECIDKLSKIHDHKGILMVIWFSEPSEQEKSYFLKAWMSKVGDLSNRVEHEVLQQEELPSDA